MCWCQAQFARPHNVHKLPSNWLISKLQKDSLGAVAPRL